jgi:hypothetical protein
MLSVHRVARVRVRNVLKTILFGEKSVENSQQAYPTYCIVHRASEFLF